MTSAWRMIALAFLIATAAPSLARAEAEWDACVAAPTRACVLDLAARDVASIEDRFDRASGLADLAVARFNAGLASDAERDFATAAQALQNDDAPVPGYGSRPMALGRLAGALAQAGRIDEAIRTVDEITINDGSAARAMTAIATAQAKAGRASEAAQTCARAYERTLALNSPQGKSGLLRAISSAQRPAGLTGDASRSSGLAREMALADQKASGRDFDLVAIAREEAAAGDVAAGLQTAALVNESAQRDLATLDVLHVALEAGKFDEAKPIAPTLSGTARARGFDAIADSLAKAGRKAESGEALANARQTVMALPDGLGKTIEMMVVAGLESRLSGADVASADMGSARTMFDALPAGAKGYAAPALVSALVAVGRASEALALAGAMAPDHWRDAAYMSASFAQAKSGDFSGALRSLQQTTAREFRPLMLEQLAGAMPN